MLWRLEEPDLAVTCTQEALQRLEAQAQVRAKTNRANAGNAKCMSRIGSDSGAAERQQNGSRTKAFLSEGSPHARALDTSRTDSPGPSEALSGPSLIFNDSATSKDRCGWSIHNPGVCLTNSAYQLTLCFIPQCWLRIIALYGICSRLTLREHVVEAEVSILSFHLYPANQPSLVISGNFCRVICCLARRLKRLNPFNGLHPEQYAAESGRRPGCRTKGGVPSNTAETACAAPARTAVGRPVSPPRAVPKQEDNPVGPALGPGKEGLER